MKGTDAHDFFKYYLLVLIAPAVSLGAIVNYIVFVFFLRDGYTAAYWALLASIWSTSLSGYLIKYRVQLKQRYHRLPLLSNLDEEEPSELRKKRNERSNSTSYAAYDSMHMGKLSEKSVTFELDDVFAAKEKTFFLTSWGGLGIAVCIVGIICGTSAAVSSLFISEYYAGAWALVGTIFAALSAYAIITHQPRRKVKPPRVWDCVTVWKMVGKVILVLLILCLIPLFLLSSLQSCVNAYNRHHFKPPGALYTIGGGHKLHLNCQGSGSPIVLFNHAIAGQALDWAWIQPQVANVTTACSFDRAGYGWSDSTGKTRTSESHAEDLHLLLEAAGLGKEHFIMVGHKQSILYMQAFLRIHMDHDVCGLVCVDCIDANSTEFQFANENKKGPVPNVWTVGRNVMPSGLYWLMAAFKHIPLSDTMFLLPDNVHEEYLQNLFKPRYPESVVLEYQQLPKSVAQTIEHGDLGDMPLAVIAAGRGYNATSITKLSVNATLLYLSTAPSDIIFHESYSRVITQHTIQLVNSYRTWGCNSFAPGGKKARTQN